MKNKREIIYGLAGGVAVIIFSIVMYSIDRVMFIGSLVFWVSTAILILFMVLAMLHARSGTVASQDFKDLLKVGFLVYVVGNLLCYVFMYVMFNTIDPELQDIQREQAIEFWMNQSGGDEDSYEVQMAKEHDYSMTVLGTLFTYAQGLIFGFLVSALFAYMMKEKPYFNENI